MLELCSQQINSASMAKTVRETTTPGSKQSPTDAIRLCNSGGSLEPGSGDQKNHAKQGKSEFPRNKKHTTKFATLNIRTLIKPGKLLNLTEKLTERNVKLIALQETRFSDDNHINYNGYRFLKGKPADKITIKGFGKTAQYGTAFVIHESILHHVVDFHSTSSRLSTISLKFKNKGYTLINCHAPTNNKNHTDQKQTEQFWTQLEKEVQNTPKHHALILLGDFNAQIGKERENRETTGMFSAHKRTNENGERLIDICKNINAKIMSTSMQNRKSRKTTWTSPNIDMGEFQIDHVTINKPHIQDIRNVRVRKFIDMDSDHYMTEITMNIIPNRKAILPKQRKIDPELLQKNKEKIQETLELDPQKTWTETHKEITDKILKLSERKRKKRHSWWTMECDNEIDKRATAWKKYQAKRTQENWSTFLQVQKKTNKIIRNARRTHDKQTHQNLEEQFQKNNTREFFKIFKQQTTTFNPPTLHFLKQDGKLAIDNKTNLKLLKDYFNTLLNCEKPTVNFTFSPNKNRNKDSQPPNRKEVKEIISSLNDNKAAGEDGIISEIWKTLGGKGEEFIHRLIQKIWDEEQIPEEWKNAVIVPLHKKGDKSNINNYRGISLLPVTYKILSKALLKRLESQTDHQIGEYQAGFRKHRSTSEQILNLKNIINFRRLRNKQTYIVFVDFMKAYDSIDRGTLIHIMEEFGVDRKTTELIKQTLHNTKSKVKFQGELSEEFTIETGLRQGDGLSPLLFNIVLEKIIRELTKELETHKIPGIQLGRNKSAVRYLAFADDIALLAENLNHARVVLEKLHEIAQKTGLKISYTKTEYFDPSNTTTKLTTKYGEINRVTKFKYLGEIIQQNGREIESNKERYNKLQKLYFITQNSYNKKSISMNAKLRHYNTVIKPVALYASETLELARKSDMEKLVKMERRIIRKILGPQKEEKESQYRIKSNREVYKHIEKITTTMKKRRLKFYGHIQRLDDSKLTKQIIKTIDQKCTVKWIEQVRQDARKLGIKNTDFEDRRTYRKIIHEAKFAEGTPKKKTGALWTEERKQKFSEQMKLRWEQKRQAGEKWKKN